MGAINLKSAAERLHNLFDCAPILASKDVLVTGGTGFIRGHLAETFAREGHDVIVLDNFKPYYDIGVVFR